MSRIENIEVMMQRALEAQSKGNCARARELYLKILKKSPGHPGANHFYGLLLHEEGRREQALGYMLKSLKNNPSPVFFANVGNVYEADWNLEEAQKYYAQALAWDPNMPQALVNAGVVCQKLGYYDQAETYYRKALAAAPDFVQAHWNLSQLLLLKEQYDEGWREFEWRLKLPGALKVPPPDVNILKGGTHDAVVINEMGYGDAIQFIRFLPQCRERFPYVRFWFACPEPLRRLFMDSFGADNLILNEQLQDMRGIGVPILSLPRLLDLKAEQVSGAPYLKVSQRLSKRWGRMLESAAGGKLKIGLVWSGSPTHVNDRVRSIKLMELTECLQLPRIKFFSLQKGFGLEQLSELSENIRPVDFGNEIKNFADTAAMISNLDLVITADTSVLHLAGALGVKTYGLIYFSPDWRWGLNSDKTQWYDSVTLFRQRKLFDWSDCIVELKKALLDLQ